MLPILLIVVNNIEQVVEPECSPQSGVTMLNNIANNIEQCGQHNIVKSCFQQPVATHNFWPCIICDSVYLRYITIFKITEVGDMGNLRQFINEYGCSMQNASRFVSQIGEAVSFLHVRRFIHRNLRASSVFVYSDGNVSTTLTFWKLKTLNWI